MKKLITIIAVLVGLQALSQNIPPQAINFQGVAIDKNGIPVPGMDELGNPIQNAGIKVRFSILEGSATGVTTYREVHETITDEFGRFNLEIGLGSNAEGVFQDIQWGSKRHFLKVEVDLSSAGSNYQLASIQEFLSVPYALYARASKSSDDDLDKDPQNEIQTLTITNDTVLSISGSNTVYLPTSVGPQGIQGIPGPTGANGLDGKSVLNGTSNPTASLGANGDFYINTATNTLFGPKTAGTWPSGVSLVGPTGLTGAAGPAGANGLDGKSVLNGTSNPTALFGVNGDFYINTSTNTLFGPKSGGLWSTGVSLVGPAGPQGLTGATGPQGSTGTQGPIGPQGLQGIQGVAGPAGMDGKTILNGVAAPLSTQGVLGDFYLNIAGKILYGPKTSFGWGSGTSLIGPQGVTGATGPQGTTGPPGPAGPIGLTGPAGVSGTNGAIGLSALINTTAEPVSSNCQNGGIKVETGLDSNSNGLLEQNEINLSQTKYVCNGASFGFNNSPYSSMDVFSSPGSYVWICPVNVSKVMVELWGGGGAGTGTGGQGGGYGKQILSVTPAQNYFIEVGAGGCAYMCYSSPAAEKGGNSSFGPIYANGGSGVNSQISICNSNINNGISNAAFNITGGAGRASDHTSGGSSFGIWSAPPGTNGQEPGGGSGQMNNNFPCGGNGRVVVYY